MAENEKAVGPADAIAGVVVVVALNYWQSSELQQHCYSPNQYLPDLRPLSPETTSQPLSDGPIDVTLCFLIYHLESNKNKTREA